MNLDLTLLGTGVLIFALLFLAAVFSGSETALTAASHARINRLASEGFKRALAVNALIANRERLIGALLLGNSLANISASALATSVLIRFFGDAGVAVATFVMTAMILIFAEVLPKTYAILNPERSAMAVAPIIRAFVSVFAPVVTAVQVIVRGTFRLFGLKIDGAREVLSAHEEIRGQIDLHHQSGEVVKRDRDMLGGILDLADLQVSEVMVHRKSIETIDADLAPAEIVALALKSMHTRLPLYRDDPDNIVGVLHAKDLLRAIAASAGNINEVDIRALARKPWFVPETTPVREQLNAFLRRRNHFALVVDEYGALMGLVTLEDILEEIVGEIDDEYDVKSMGIRPQTDGSVNVDGTVAIRDLNRTMDWNLPDDEATTIAGLVIHEAQMIPEPGQIFAFHGYKFEIMRKQRNQITAIRISRVNPKASAA
jgi:Mg2+/Co2+ transporter CorB